MDVWVHWTELDSDDYGRRDEQYCLYAYLHPTRNQLLYIGKADYSTVGQRLHGDHKDQLFEDIWRSYGVDEVRILHGELEAEEGYRRSSELLADVESLLIMRLQPFGNISTTQSRIARPGLRVHCEGDWPFKRRRFHDE
jgi:hypothetical protein